MICEKSKLTYEQASDSYPEDQSRDLGLPE